MMNNFLFRGSLLPRKDERSPQGLWVWTGPLTPEQRIQFWDVVQRHDSIVLENCNQAIIGLAWGADMIPSVVYSVRRLHQLIPTLGQSSVAGSARAETRLWEQVRQWLTIPIPGAPCWCMDAPIPGQ